MIERGVVHIIDDEASVRQSLDFLARTAGYKTHRWTDGDHFLKGADKFTPACVLLDIKMPGSDGLKTQDLMRASGFDFPVIVLTGHGDIATAVKAMQVGAVDFLAKPFDRQQLLDALDVAFRMISDRSAMLARKDLACAMIARLTEREREVLDGLACGFPNKTVAYDLGISSRTVEVYRANLMEKLGVNSFAAALRIAFAAGLGSESSWLSSHVAMKDRINADK